CRTIVFRRATPTTCIYTLSLHDALPISVSQRAALRQLPRADASRAIDRRHTASRRNHQARRRLPAHAADPRRPCCARRRGAAARSEEHTSELQSRENLVCRLLLEKKNTQ